MDEGYIIFPKEVTEYYEIIGHPLEVDENNGMIVKGIFDYGCVGDIGAIG